MPALYGLADDDLAIQRKTRALIDELIPYEVEAEMNGGELPSDVSQEMKRRVAELGLLAINMPAALGGGGLTMLQQVLVQEQTGRVTNALGWVVPSPPAWFAAVATEYQRERWVIPAIAGAKRECYAITEETSGSAVDIRAAARGDGDGYVLDGVKWHVTSFNEADYVFFQARLRGGDNDGAHAMFIVDLPTPGVRVVRTPAYSHTFAHHHPIVAFEGVRVPASHRVGDEDDGLAYAYEWFRYERLMIAARCIGAAERLIDEATCFAKQRQAQGRAIIEFQAVQALLADSLTELWAAKTMTYETARHIDAGGDPKQVHTHCSMVKLYASEMAGRVADRAVQVFGGRGYMRECVAERFYRELRVERIWEGTSEIQRGIIAGQLARRGVTGLI